MAKQYYYLTVDEINHYQYMIDHGYHSELVNINNQKYIYFKIVDKPVGIAWPTISGKIDGIPTISDIIFEHSAVLQRKVMPLIKSKVKVLLFPRYAN